MEARKLQDLMLVHETQLLALIAEENGQQIEKWGVQYRTPFEWITYLVEEVGELADAISEREYRSVGTELAADQAVVKEARQAATLALKIAEMYLHPEESERPTCAARQP